MPRYGRSEPSLRTIGPGVRFTPSGTELGTEPVKSAVKNPVRSQLSAGAGEGNRTLVCSLGSCRSTIELRPRRGGGL